MIMIIVIVDHKDIVRMPLGDGDSELDDEASLGVARTFSGCSCAAGSFRGRVWGLKTLGLGLFPSLSHAHVHTHAHSHAYTDAYTCNRIWLHAHTPTRTDAWTHTFTHAQTRARIKHTVYAHWLSLLIYIIINSYYYWWLLLLVIAIIIINIYYY